VSEPISDKMDTMASGGMWPQIVGVVRAAEKGFARSQCGSCDAGLPMNCTCNEMDGALASLREALEETE